MRILVTGGAGFLGRHLCRRLKAEGHQVVIVDDGSTGDVYAAAAEFGEVLRHDVREPLDLFKVDRIYHLACPASPVHYQTDPEHTLTTGFLGTLNVLRYAARCGARLLLTSTSEVYGDPAVSPQPESYWGNVNSFGPRACYDEGKRAGEALAFVFRGRVDVRVARIFNTYGPGMRMDDGRVVSNLIVQALQDKPLTLHGAGQQTRSFCYVDDTIEGLVRLMELGSNHDYVRSAMLDLPVNIGNPAEVTVRELAYDILAGVAHGRPWDIHEAPAAPDDPRRRCPDISRAQRLLGWTPQVPLIEGLRRTIEDFRTRLATKEAA